MSSVRVCSNCGYRDYASTPGAPRQRTIEQIEDDTVVKADDRVVCRVCYEQLQDACIEELDGHETREGVYSILSAWEGQDHD